MTHTHNKTDQTIQILESKNKYMEVRSSGIHRTGGFAIQDIPKGTRIIEYIGRKIGKEEYERIDKELNEKFMKDKTAHPATYMFEITEELYVDGDIPENDAKFINHSCNPNCEVEIEEERIYIDAIKDIKKGEELFFNYGFELEEDNIYSYKDHPCWCGSENCVGYILAEDEWPRLKELEKENNKY